MGDIRTHDQPSWPRRIAWFIILASGCLAAVGTIISVAGSVSAGWQLSGAFVSFIPGTAATLLFFHAAWRGRAGEFLGASLVSIVGGLLTAFDTFVGALSAGYANPCFEIAHCTRGPTLAYVALTIAAVAFLAATLLGVVISPAALVFAGWRRRVSRTGGVPSKLSSQE